MADGAEYLAKLTGKETFKYGQRVNGVVKSATQLTKENATLMGKIATRVNIAGGVIGVFDSGLQAYDDFSNGYYGLGSYETAKGTAYLIGLGLCTNPFTLAAGLTVIGVTGIIDIAGDVGLYIYGVNR